MSEKFNPLAEAESNASHDRRRFYDWVGDGADHADNEGFRAANADMVDYLKSRDYTDDNGAFHDAESGKFIGNPNEEKEAKESKGRLSNEDAYYNRMLHESTGEGLFAGKGLKDIAEMVRDAKARDDKTMELEARAAFDDKFMAMAEKYDWQGTVENEDGTVTDRNEIADSKLAYYEDIMDGAGAKPAKEKPVAAPEATPEEKKEADSDESSVETPEQDEVSEEKTDAEDAAKNEPEDQPKNSEKISEDEFDQNDMAELRKKLDAEDAAGEHKPKHRAEFSDEDTPLFDAVKSDLGQSEESAHEGESQEEFEARQPGRHSSAADRMRVIAAGGTPSAEESSAADRMRQIAGSSEEESDEETSSRRGRLRRLRDIATPTGASAAATAWAANREYRRNNAEQGRSGRARKLGWLAAGLVAGGAITYLRFKGHDVPHGGTHGTLDPGDALKNLPPADGTGTEGLPPAQEIIKSIRVNPGDGEIKVTQHILDQMGIHVNATDAQRIGEHAHVDLLVGDRNYDDASSVLNRVGGNPGVYNIRPGSVEALVQSAKDLGLDK